MVLPKEPWQPKDTKLQYYAYRYDTLFLVLNYILCPFTCGCFYCWTTPRDQIASDMIHNGLSVDERMSDLHFARQERKFNRRNTLSADKPGGKVKEILSHHKRASSQHLSPLFAKLPYEIRTRIFQQTLFDTGAVFIDTVPITSRRRSLHKLRVRACELELGYPPGLGDLYKVSPSHLMRKSRVDTALLRTCRLVYKETLPMLYAQTRFVFKDPRHLVAFSHSIPRTHFEHIRSIRLDFSEISKAPNSDNRTFVTPFLEPMQEFLGAIRLLRQLRSLYIVFRVAKHMRVPRSEVEVLLEDMQEYQGRIMEATFEQCETHLLVFFWAKLVHQRIERGLLSLTSMRFRLRRRRILRSSWFANPADLLCHHVRCSKARNNIFARLG